MLLALEHHDTPQADVAELSGRFMRTSSDLFRLPKA